LALTFDLKSVFQDVFSDPAHYGFKFNYPGWLGTGSADPNEYMFWDSLHPSGSMHGYIADRFLPFYARKVWQDDLKLAFHADDLA